MPPVDTNDDVRSQIQEFLAKNPVMIFSKKKCPFCIKVKDLFKSLNAEYHALELDTLKNGSLFEKALTEMTHIRTVPKVYIHGKFIGGCDDVFKLHSESRLVELLKDCAHKYDYDLIVIGGGSGGLAAAKEAAGLGKKVALLDFVKPTPVGTSWGLGGTCVNVGCIPKKLMHRASILGEEFHDSQTFGWDVQAEGVKHKWNDMVSKIQDYIGSLNWNYRVQLRDKDVNYVNATGKFIAHHMIEATNKRGKCEQMSAKHFIIATGERPRYPDTPGVKEYSITSDDLFSLPYCPGKTLCVGASYVSLECAGFLAGLGLDVTVMVRSILLRGFDQQMADKIGDYMENHKVNFIRGAVPSKIEKLKDGQPGLYQVTAKTTDGKEIVGEYNTILHAIGRDPCTTGLGLEEIGIELNPKNGRVIVDDHELTSVSNIHAIGDILDGKLQLTPVAIQAGRLLVQRLYNGGKTLCDYLNVATTVFTPIEYGSIGYPEEAALEKFGADNIEVYHSSFSPLEWTIPGREADACYVKLICHIPEKEKVIGFHYLGPNAGEVTQGFAIAMKKGATKSDFDDTIGIHPTCSENLTTLSVTKRSGEALAKGGC